LSRRSPFEPDALAGEMERREPQLVICSGLNIMGQGGMLAWVDRSVDHRRPTKVCVGGNYREYTAPLALETLPEILDEVEQLARTQGDSRVC
jgi:hypothetical protein